MKRRAIRLLNTLTAKIDKATEKLLERKNRR